MGIVGRLTAECQREDCAIQFLGAQSTLIGFTPTYDKRGKLSSPDPNRTVSHYRCTTCGTEWRTERGSRDGETDKITKIPPQRRNDDREGRPADSERVA